MERWLRRLVHFFVILPLSWIIGLVAVPALLIFFISFLAWGIRKLDDLVDQVIAKLMDSELPGFISEDVVRRLSGFGLPISELLKNALTFLGPKFGRENRLLESIQRQQEEVEVVQTYLESSGPMGTLRTRLNERDHVPVFGIVGVFLIVASFAIRLSE